MFRESSVDFSKVVDKAHAKFFPMKLTKGYFCQPTDNLEFYQFMRKNFSKAFPKAASQYHFNVQETSEQRKLHRVRLFNDYGKAHHDHLIFYDRDHKPMGWFCGESEDSQTYYMRNTGIFKQHQGQGLYSKFLPQILAYLKYLGYERVSSHHHGDNPQVLIPKLKAGFIIAGMECHENWGTLIKLVRHLYKDRRDFFVDKYI